MTQPDSRKRKQHAIGESVDANVTKRDDETLTAAWAAFVAEAEALLRIDAADMRPEELERLERLSDPLIQLYGYYQRSRPASPVYSDPRLLEYLARQEATVRPRREHTEREPEGLLSEREIRSLSERVLATLEAERLGVRAVDRSSPNKPASPPVPASSVLDLVEHAREAPLLELSVAAGAGRELWDAECDTIVALPRDVPRGRYIALRVSGDSMEPLLHPGDVALVKLGPAVVPQTVVVARDEDDGYVVKRVGRVTARAIELLSLNPAYAPLRIPRRAHAVLGTVVLRWCAHGTRA